MNNPMPAAQIRKEIYSVIQELTDISNAHSAMQELAACEYDDGANLSASARNGLAVIFKGLGDRTFKLVDRLEVLAEELEIMERQGGGDA